MLSGGEFVGMCPFDVRDGKGERKRVNALIDTGSMSKSFIHPDLVRRLGLDGLVDRKKSSVRVANDSELEIEGTVILNILIENRKDHRIKEFEFAVASIPLELIMGYRELTAWDAVINLGSSQISLGGLRINLVNRKGEHNVNCVNFVGSIGIDEQEHIEKLEKQKDITPSEAKQALDNILERYESVFGEAVGSNMRPMTVDLKEKFRDRIISMPPRQRSKEADEALDREVENELRLGIIEKSRSPWNFQVMMIPKPGGGWRKVMNFVPLNKWIEDYSFPLPTIDYCLDSTQGSRVFSAMDCKKGFNQQRVGDEETKNIFSFTTRRGKWRNVCLPQGVKTATGYFQEGMSEVIESDILWRWILLYIDDILIHTKTLRAHLYVLELLLSRLKAAKVKLNRDKCEFMKPKVNYLGSEVTGEKIKPKEESIKNIRGIPIPKTKKELNHFVAMTQWHLARYVPDFAGMVMELREAGLGKGKLMMTTDLREAFLRVRELATEKLVNTHFVPGRPIELAVDASGSTVCALLFQEEELVRCASRKMTKTERGYSTTERELLAIIYGCKKYRKYLLGTKFVTFTDHKPLVSIFKKQRGETDRINNMLGKLTDYNTRVEYVEGKKMKADYWTREKKDFDEDRSPIQDGFVFTVVPGGGGFRYTSEDKKVLRGYKSKRRVAMGVEVKVKEKWKLFAPREKRRALLWEMHRERHEGIVGMKKKAGAFHWPGWSGDIEDLVRGCECIQKKEGKPVKNKDYVEVKAENPLDLVAIDVYSYAHMGDFLTFKDIASARMWVKELPNGHSQKEVTAKYREWEQEVRVPKRILSDRGSEFNLIRGNRTLTSAWHPQSNGKLERAHKELANLCREHNIGPVEALQFYNTDEINLKFYKGWAGLKPLPPRKKERKQQQSAVRSFEVGDIVVRHIVRRARNKAENTHTGLFRITEKKGPVTYGATDGTARTFQFHCDLLKKVVIPDSRGWRLTGTQRAECWEEWGIGDEPLFGEQMPVEDLLEANWEGKRVMVGAQFQHNTRIVDKIERDNPEFVVWVVPEIRCEEWYRRAESLEAHWNRVKTLVDRDGNEVGRFPFNVWVAFAKKKE